MISTYVRAKRFDDNIWDYGSIFLAYYAQTNAYDYFYDSRSGVYRGKNIVTLLSRDPISLYNFRDDDTYIDTNINPIVDPETICSYIGIEDKNGIKIFKNDIVKTKHGRLCKVIYFTSPNYIGWDLAPLEIEHPDPDKFDLWLPENLEVIGNVYDNPELIKEIK